jgi:hypothetical protein
MKNNSMITQVCRRDRATASITSADSSAIEISTPKYSPKKMTVIQVGEAINDNDRNRPPAAPVAIVKPPGRGGCVDPDQRDCDDPGLPL